MRSLHGLSGLALAVALSASSASRGLADDAAADFSATSNPSGHWSYGSSATRDAAFVLYTEPGTDPAGLSTWNAPFLGLPHVNHNGTGHSIVTTASFPPGALSLHPGGAGEKSVVRWTAPMAGTYQITATFVGRSGVAGNPVTTTDVAVRHGSTELFSGWINQNGAGNTTSWSGSREMEAGTSIDFMVGIGTNDYTFDTTGLDAVVTPAIVDVGAAAPVRAFTVSVMPNPARAGASFAIGLPRASVVSVRIFDLSGRLVREIWNGTLPAGTSQLSWNRHDAGARVAAPGLYLLRVDGGERSLKTKFVLVR